ncbi:MULTISPECIES: threonine/serine exporter family protein [Anaerotruncus]|uniref:Threonine/serine exporter n=3 Tax=Anaerotruncus TaxID=244127 RepID=A0A498D409_9FIRM|nr:MULTISPECIES: threonine/serine exporter family protein [Anaerotruncus]MBC3937279.1 threonine/serine exporter family protein [Anaerotruncus massiliensis (ex Togo et al. 2019)]MCQ4895404.1 threonine/serine exporter family protein [Anaerotruncus sp. DFI.9.16]RLL14411.1 threonine/serine exporter [Anaerotruncus massiliensis (ex Liu et al. 2021)]GKH47223.1 membrane protein [Oscillospiraceae bacterium]
MELLLPCLYSFMGCVGYCLVFNIRMRKRMLLLASLGGAVGWCVYLLCGWLQNDITQSFAAILAVAAYSEIMARLQKSPATVYLIVGLIPLVPGGGIYYTMEYCINGDMMNFMNTGIHTLGIAGALAIGILLVSACVRILNNIQRRKRRETA